MPRVTHEEEPHVSLKWLIAVAMISVGCAGAPGPAATPATLAAPIPAVSTAAMDAHLKYLADDLLEGRAPATRGGRLAAKYIAAQFAALGLEPAGSDGSYFQPVALVGMTLHPSLVWGKGGATRSLAYLDDFVAWAERPESHIVADEHDLAIRDDVTLRSLAYLDDFVAWAYRPESHSVADVAVDVTSALRHVRSENVVARIPGSDPALTREAVLFTAHWDHKGIGPVANGDSIYNGAEDNASGVAAMLGAAEALVEVQPRPRRTLLFIATTAEESGLLGSEAYTRDPLVPLEQTAAVINLDVTNVRGATRDIDALGVDRSTLGAVFDAAARAESLAVVHEPDVRGSFYRSDHFPFSKAGVPALSIEPGRDFVGRPAGWGEQEATRYNRERYHQPGDEYRPTFTYAGMAQEVRVAMRVALAVANAPAMPRWLPNSEFQRPAGRAHP